MLDFSTSYGKNELVISTSELKDMYLFGIQQYAKFGQELSTETYKTYILAAQQEVERFLGIKLFKQVIEENLSYYRDEFTQFGYIRTSFPCVQPLALDGYIGTLRQISYPSEWLTFRKTNDLYSYSRNMYIVPNIGAARTGSIVYSGVIPYVGIASYDQIPDYWTVKYITGYEKLPYDLTNIIGKLAAINVLLILGNIVLGKPGVSSQSLGIDGLSQSLSSQLNPFSGQIKQYKEDIQTTLDRIQSSFRGLNLTSV